MSDQLSDDDVLWHQSGVNQRGEPFVQLLRGRKVIGQMDPEQARDHAQAILEAAEAAEQDAFIMDFARNEIGVDDATAAKLLVGFREYRAKRTNKRGGPTRASDWIKPE